MKRLWLAGCLCFFSAAVFAADLNITNGWIRLLPAGVPAAGYFELHNTGNTAAELVGASSPAFGQATLHRTAEDRGRSTMLHLHGIRVPAGGKLIFGPGGYHIMLSNPAAALRIGDKVPVTLEFATGERSSARFEVRGPTGK